MFLSVKNLSNYTIEATDGTIGHVHSFLFDDQNWAIRYLVVDAGTWLLGRKVLVAPAALGKPEGQMEVFPVGLTREQVKGSADIDTEKPVSRQQEIELHKYYNWAPYWVGTFGPTGILDAPVVPGVNTQGKESQPASVEAKEETDPHLRSTKEVLGYKIHAEDGQIGHVEDFIVHVDDWIIRYMVVDTRSWLPGRKVMISPDWWIKDISWADSEVVVDVTRDLIEGSPEFDPAYPVNREYETRLYDYYGRPKYWL
jgi:hypothetical protein